MLIFFALLLLHLSPFLGLIFLMFFAVVVHDLHFDLKKLKTRANLFSVAWDNAGRIVKGDMCAAAVAAETTDTSNVSERKPFCR